MKIKLLIFVMTFSVVAAAETLTLAPGESSRMTDQLTVKCSASVEEQVSSSSCRIVVRPIGFFTDGCRSDHPYTIVDRNDRLVSGCFVNIESAGVVLKKLMAVGTCR